MLVELVFQYRTLVGKCELGVGLDWDEIEQISTIESAFAATAAPPTADDQPMKDSRRFRRKPTSGIVLLRGDRINDRVELVEIGPAAAVVRNAPFVAHGEHVELVMDNGSTSYRFSAEGVWLKDDGDDYLVGLQLVGMPVCLRGIAASKPAADVVERVPTATPVAA